MEALINSVGILSAILTFLYGICYEGHAIQTLSRKMKNKQKSIKALNK